MSIREAEIKAARFVLTKTLSSYFITRAVYIRGHLDAYAATYKLLEFVINSKEARATRIGNAFYIQAREQFRGYRET